MKIDLNEVIPQRRKVAIPGMEGHSLTVREPTIEERYGQWYFSHVRADGTTDVAKLFAFRLRVIEDWEGFTDQNGNPLQFNPKTMELALRKSKEFLFGVANIVRDAFEGLEDDDAKNSDPRPGDTSPAADNVTVTEPTGESISGSNTDLPVESGAKTAVSG